MAVFVACIREGGVCSPSGADGRAATAAALAAQRSLQSGRPVSPGEVEQALA